MLFVLKIPLASFGHSCCGRSVCSVRTFQKPKQYHPELLTSLAKVIHHVLGTCTLLDKPNNICCTFCNFPLISSHFIFTCIPCAREMCVWSHSHARELGIRHFSTGQRTWRETGAAASWELAGVPVASIQWPLKRFASKSPWLGGHCTWETTHTCPHKQLAH